MKRFVALLFALAACTGSVCAAPRSVTLSLPTMDCAVCPITVKAALAKVPGVAQAEVDFDRREATVTFDDAKATTEDLTRATGDAGYPSTLVGRPE
jgi:mercuric ion binding protein